MRFLSNLAAVCLIVVASSWISAQENVSSVVVIGRKKLEARVTVIYQKAPLVAVVDDLKRQVDGLNIWIDVQGGVSRNETFTYEAIDKSVGGVLDDIFRSVGLGYDIDTDKDSPYEGWLIIKKLKTDASQRSNKAPDADSTDETPRTKDSTVPRHLSAKVQQEAARKLKLAMMLEADGLKKKARERYKEIIREYPKSESETRRDDD